MAARLAATAARAASECCAGRHGVRCSESAIRRPPRPSRARRRRNWLWPQNCNVSRRWHTTRVPCRTRCGTSPTGAQDERKMYSDLAAGHYDSARVAKRDLARAQATKARMPRTGPRPQGGMTIPPATTQLRPKRPRTLRTDAVLLALAAKNGAEVAYMMAMAAVDVTSAQRPWQRRRRPKAQKVIADRPAHRVLTARARMKAT